MGHGNGVGNGTEAATLPSHAASTLTPHISSSLHNDKTNTQHNTTFSDEDHELEPVQPDQLWDNLTDTGFARVFRLILRDNPHASDPPKGWVDMWAKDFQQLLAKYSNPEIFDLLVISQIEKNQPYYVRAKSLFDKAELLREMVHERAKQMPALRMEFKKKYKRLEAQHGRI